MVNNNDVDFMNYDKVLSQKYNGVDVLFGPSTDNDVMIFVTDVVQLFPGKRINNFLRSQQTQELINQIANDAHISASEVCYSTKGKYSDGRPQGTWMRKELAINLVKWLNDPKLLKFIIDLIINYKIGQLPEKARIYEENFLNFYCRFLEIVNNNLELLSYCEEPTIELNKPTHIKNIGEKTYFYFPINNTVYKLNKEEILNIVCIKGNKDEILDVIKYLDTILEKSDYLYLKLKYLELDNLIIDNNNSSKSNQKTYLMKDSNTGLIKIGKAIDPKFRERTLQSEKPTISLFAICDNLIEDELHEKYNDKRVRGEWFKLGEDEVSDIIKEYDFR